MLTLRLNGLRVLNSIGKVFKNIFSTAKARNLFCFFDILSSEEWNVELTLIWRLQEWCSFLSKFLTLNQLYCTQVTSNYSTRRDKWWEIISLEHDGSPTELYLKSRCRRGFFRDTQANGLRISFYHAL